jgi:hypothetical protein
MQKEERNANIKLMQGQVRELRGRLTVCDFFLCAAKCFAGQAKFRWLMVDGFF